MFEKICGSNCSHYKLNGDFGSCSETPCKYREHLIQVFNSLGIEDMEEITELNLLRGSFINMEYTFPGGQTAMLWDDEKIYLGNEICKKGSAERCYGVAANETYLMVCQYGNEGANPELVVFKRWN